MHYQLLRLVLSVTRVTFCNLRYVFISIKCVSFNSTNTLFLSLSLSFFVSLFFTYPFLHISLSRDLSLSLSLFPLSFYLPLFVSPLLHFAYQISREKFENEPEFEPRTSGFDNVDFPRHTLCLFYISSILNFSPFIYFSLCFCLTPFALSLFLCPCLFLSLFLPFPLSPFVYFSLCLTFSFLSFSLSPFVFLSFSLSPFVFLYLSLCFSGDQQRENFWLGPVIRLGGAVGSASAHIAGDPVSNPSSGDNFSVHSTT